MDIQTIDADTDFLAGSTSATYSTTNKRRNHNIAYQEVAVTIWESDGTWSYDDSNNTDGPVAYRSLANASAAYLIPTTAIRIEGVEVQDAEGSWHVMELIALEDLLQLRISPEEYLTGVGMPFKAALKGNEIHLFPAPGTGYTTMASGMAVRLSRMVTNIAVTATTTTPGFVSAYHRILSLSGAIDFIRDPEEKKLLISQKDRLMKGMTRFYARRNDSVQTSIKPAGKKRWRTYT